MATPSGADTLANVLVANLIAGKDFTLPDINLDDPIFAQPNNDGDIFDPIPKLTTEDLTTGVVGGSGVFDRLMVSLVAHLKVEYEQGRISGAEYTKAYIGMITAALQTSAQYLLGKDQAYWQALLIQRQAQLADLEVVKGRLELETARAGLVRALYESVTSEVNYALTKMKVSTEDATYANLTTQKIGLEFDNDIKDFTKNNILPLQQNLLAEQVEVQRSQTADTRTDGEVIVGLIGKQKDLYTQQVTSYKRDAETKAAKLFTDAWITQKTIDEGLIAPTNFTNAQVDVMLNRLRSNLQMTT